MKLGKEEKKKRWFIPGLHIFQSQQQPGVLYLHSSTWCCFCSSCLFLPFHVA